MAEEQNWDQTTTLKYLVRKAGYYGKLDDVYNNFLSKISLILYIASSTTSALLF